MIDIDALERHLADSCNCFYADELAALVTELRAARKVVEAARAFLRDHEEWMGDRNEVALGNALEALK